MLAQLLLENSPTIHCAKMRLFMFCIQAVCRQRSQPLGSGSFALKSIGFGIGLGRKYDKKQHLLLKPEMCLSLTDAFNPSPRGSFGVSI